MKPITSILIYLAFTVTYLTAQSPELFVGTMVFTQENGKTGAIDTSYSEFFGDVQRRYTPNSVLPGSLYFGGHTWELISMENDQRVVHLIDPIKKDTFTTFSNGERRTEYEVSYLDEEVEVDGKPCKRVKIYNRYVKYDDTFDYTEIQYYVPGKYLQVSRKFENGTSFYHTPNGEIPVRREVKHVAIGLPQSGQDGGKRPRIEKLISVHPNQTIKEVLATHPKTRGPK